jgi:hypothetical protein
VKDTYTTNSYADKQFRPCITQFPIWSLTNKNKALLKQTTQKPTYLYEKSGQLVGYMTSISFLSVARFKTLVKKIHQYRAQTEIKNSTTTTEISRSIFHDVCNNWGPKSVSSGTTKFYYTHKLIKHVEPMFCLFKNSTIWIYTHLRFLEKK